MELLQSVITNSYPSLSTLLKFWLTQLIDLSIQVFTTYPINVALCVSVLVILVHKIISKFVGDKSFRAKYKPL